MSPLEKQRKQYEIKKAKKNLIRLVLILVIFLGGALLLIQPVMHYVLIPHVVEEANAKTATVTGEKIEDNMKKIRKKIKLSGDDYYGDVSEIDPNITYNPENVTSVNSVPINAKINNDYIVGKILIPNVNLNLTILEGISDANLNVATGTMKPGQKMGEGNYAIAGHHMMEQDLLFTPLMNVKKYDDIYLTDKNKIYEYLVTNVFIVSPNQGSVIDDSQGNKILTLVTCSDVQGTKRLIVRGKLIKSYPFEQGSNEVKLEFLK